jgi:glutamyl/glutaminyl-tRNA synthetase
VLRNDDLDAARSRPHFWDHAREDLAWLGLDWDESPEEGGPFGPYRQSQRAAFYASALEQLSHHLYVCRCTRKQLAAASLSAPHEGQEEPVYAGTCRELNHAPGTGAWRFRVPDGQPLCFDDGSYGPQCFIAGQDFGDFLVARADGEASYQLACVVDDAAMGVTEVVRGADLLLSTARQLLLYEALGLCVPEFYHCPLVADLSGTRLSKRSDAMSLRSLRSHGFSPAEVLELPLEQLLPPA